MARLGTGQAQDSSRTPGPQKRPPPPALPSGGPSSSFRDPMARAMGFLGGPTRVPPHNAGAPMHPLAGSRVHHLRPCLGWATGRLGNRGVGVRNRGVGMKTQACSGLGVWGRGGGRRKGRGSGLLRTVAPCSGGRSPRPALRHSPPTPKAVRWEGRGLEASEMPRTVLRQIKWK